MLKKGVQLFASGACFRDKPELCDQSDAPLTGELGTRTLGGARHSKLIAFQNDVAGWISEQPDLALTQTAGRLMREHGIKASTSGVSDMLRRAGYS